MNSILASLASYVNQSD